MDQNTKDGYNGEGELEELSESEPLPAWGAVSAKGAPAASSGGESAGLRSGSGRASAAGSKPNASVDASMDVLPDLDSMAGAFLSHSAEEESDANEYPVSAPAPKPLRSNKAPAWSEDFNAKEMAAGLRTVLNKEKEG